jgi:hypothetical protein
VKYLEGLAMMACGLLFVELCAFLVSALMKLADFVRFLLGR